ncbi:hypothetical protein CKO28_23895 [Rhodovibrio sodomensis]|uniref:Transposase DDE domain-containing protein n=1 Tax=Rhodovibrio sodomensis TaxID=1088 RepID=A0ABS1DLE6_9PROT|nr:hypothetical protein [Rhodovibrio sodomensis]
MVLDVDDTFDAVHGHQQLRLFNAHYDDYGFQPILVFDDAGRLVAAMIRPAKRPNGRQVRAFRRRLVRRIRSIWPRVDILVREPVRLPGGDGVLRGQQGGLHLWPGHHLDPASSRRDAGGEHGRALRCRRRLQGSPLQGVLRRGRQLEPRPADHRPRGGRAAGHGHALG